MLHVFSKLGISLLINIIPDPFWHVIGIIICQSIFRGELISERIPVQCGTKQDGLTSPFTTIPRWYINGVSLDIEDKLTYLGSILGENGDKEHCENRCRTAHRYFLGSSGQELSLLV